jgi:hypothetical protein
MNKQPEGIISAKLEVVVMPNGEVICLGKSVGWFKDLGKYLSEPRDMSGNLITEEENVI